MTQVTCIHFFPVDDCPNDQFLNKYIRTKVCAADVNKWRDLGIVLMGQDAADDLDVIRIDHPNNVKECCSRMFTEWRQRNPKASYKHLIDGLKKVNLVYLASEVEKLLIPSVESCIEEKSEIARQTWEEHKLILGGIYHSVNI